VIDAPATTQRILVIEDDRNVAEVVTRYLTLEGTRRRFLGRAGRAAPRHPGRAGPGRARRHAPRTRRGRGSAGSAPRHARAGDPAHRPVGRNRSGERPGARGGRLRGQALLAPGAHGPGEGRIAPGPGTTRNPCRPDRAAMRRPHGGHDNEASLVGGARGRADRPGVRSAGPLHEAPYAGVPARGASREGLASATATHLRSPSTSAACGKIETDPDAPRYIQTVRSIGYRFVAP
jgi:hypothetical protein